MPDSRILVVDDEPGILEVCDEILRELPRTRVVLESESARAAERVAVEPWDLLVTDMRMPGMDGFALLRTARQHDPGLPVLMLTAFPSFESAVESMKLGAADYLTKPFLPDALLDAAGRLLRTRRVGRPAPAAPPPAQEEERCGEILGASACMREVFDVIEHVAATDIDVLITGETGTGKELVARSIHRLSRRGERRFVPVDCSAIPEDLLESEFFGHEQGAFTGAHTRSMGLLEFAEKGTFFLDELGQLPLKLQSKLLRALQERRVRRVGGTEEMAVDVRVLAATSLDLDEEVRAGRFRSDLLYRINVAHIRLPPLRQRADDIPLLVGHFTRRYAAEMGREEMAVDERALDVLCGYAWPGNVRELQNVVKRAIAMSRRDTIYCHDLPEALVATAVSGSGARLPGFFDLREQHIASFERDFLERLLRACHGNVSEAAVSAQLPRGTFYRLIKRHGIGPAEFRD
jgi:DNA-binding NtrC family response regulator